MSEESRTHVSKEQTEDIERDLGIESFSIKCDKQLAARLRTMAAQADMELEPFMRRLCEQHIAQDESLPDGQRPRLFEWGDIRGIEPQSRDFGFRSGQPIDRYYIDLFLNSYRQDIRGRVLEVGDDSYTKRFGDGRVTENDVLHVEKTKSATIIGDLVTGHGIPVDSFDCIILTQTLPFIFDTQQAITTCRNALKGDGVLLCTVNGISQISRYDMDRWGDYWRFTDLSLKRQLQTAFEPENVSISIYGNVLSAIAFLLGLPAQELQRRELVGLLPFIVHF